MEKIHFFSLICIRSTTCEALSTRIRIFLKPKFVLNETSTLRPRNQWICFFKTALQSGLGRPVHTIVPCKRIQHNLGFWTPRRGLIRIQGTGFWSLLEELGVGIPTFLRFRIPWAEIPIPKPRISDSTRKIFPRFRIPPAKIFRSPESLTWGKHESRKQNMRFQKRTDSYGEGLKCDVWTGPKRNNCFLMSGILKKKKLKQGNVFS